MNETEIRGKANWRQTNIRSMEANEYRKFGKLLRPADEKKFNYRQIDLESVDSLGKVDSASRNLLRP